MQTNIAAVNNTIHNNFGVELEREIGRGKYGVVYSGSLIRDRRVGLAMKIISLPTRDLEDQLRGIFGSNEEAMARAVHEIASRFEAEIRSMSSLKSLNAYGKEHIIRMYNHMLIEEGTRSYIIISMELAYPLKKYLAREGLTVQNVIQIAYETAKGLKLCHLGGVIHMDIKEDNLFLGLDGKIKIGDFGVANINKDIAGRRIEGVGTPHYMAPEIKRGSGYDESVDIYSLGMVMYMLLNENRPPFFGPGVSEQEAYNRRMSGEKLPPPRHSPDLLSDIILKCCSFSPYERYRDIDLLLRDLEDVSQDLGSRALARSVPYPVKTGNEGDRLAAKFAGTKIGAELGGRTGVIENILRSTEAAFRDLLQKFSDEKNERSFIENVYTSKSIAEKKMNEAQRRVRRMRNILCIVVFAVLVLAATLVMLYPKTASFYPNPFDGDKLYAKYLFFPERKLSEHSASYVTPSGNEVFYSERDQGKQLYKVNIWTGKETLVCDKECQYDIIIGDYVYFTDNSPTGSLYRVKKDGTDLKCVMDEECGELKKVDGSLEAWIVRLNSSKIIDVENIDDSDLD